MKIAKFFVVVAPCSALAALTVCTPPVADEKSLTLVESLAYKKLTPLHKGLRDMDRETAMLCAPAALSRGPHYKPAIRTYGNKLAISGLKRTPRPTFAVGALLVKEKFETKDAKQASLITVMKKVYEGKGARSWQYMMVDLKKGSIVESVDPKRLKDPSANKCVSCHERYENTDGVSTAAILALKDAGG